MLCKVKLIKKPLQPIYIFFWNATQTRRLIIIKNARRWCWGTSKKKSTQNPFPLSQLHFTWDCTFMHIHYSLGAPHKQSLLTACTRIRHVESSIIHLCVFNASVYVHTKVTQFQITCYYAIMKLFRFSYKKMTDGFIRNMTKLINVDKFILYMEVW